MAGIRGRVHSGSYPRASFAEGAVFRTYRTVQRFDGNDRGIVQSLYELADRIQTARHGGARFFGLYAPAGGFGGKEQHLCFTR